MLLILYVMPTSRKLIELIISKGIPVYAISFLYADSYVVSKKKNGLSLLVIIFFI